MAPSIAEVTALLTQPGEMFEIEERNIRGILTKTWKNAPSSLRMVLEMSRLHGDKPFLVYEDERTSFEQHFRRCARLARVMVEDWGLRKGDRIAIAMRNFPEWSIAFWAAAAVGAVVVPLNAWWSGEELEYGLGDSGSRFLFCDGDRARRIAPHLGALAIERIAIARGGEMIAHATPFAPLIADAAADVTFPDVPLDAEDDATIFYTSGTTGRPKGALGTHRNICGNLMSLAFAQARGAIRSGAPFPPPADQPQPAQLISVPFFHATGCHSVLAANTAFGGKLVMIYKWDPERALELIERERISSFGGVPAMVWQVLESPSFAKHDLSCVRSVAYGGAPAAPELVRRIKEAFPNVAPGNGYGLTETSSVSTFNGGADYERKPDSVGLPVPVCEIRIAGPDGHDLPIGEVGEIWIKGPNVVKGYWNKPEATAETFTDGWLHSGDLGRVDDEGFVYIVDRAKDMVIRGGENVYCVEVESVLYDHPDVIDAAVIGIPDKILGEEVAAVVQVRSGSRVTQEDLQRHVAQHLAAFKVPVRIALRGEPLPRNANGKILKAQIKQEMAG
ncbi:MAG TPA: class I adenylate-forming enzyme family protein [Candidatus Kryptonia bacterium]|nr:class I adenylate-forming enzyme family protein [Candidatus Kryptonia bacterium]